MIFSFFDFFKGTVSRDFLLLVFSWISFLQAPEYTSRAVSNFFENSRRYSQLKVDHRYQRHRWQICHRYRRHRRRILPPVSLLLLIPVASWAQLNSWPCHHWHWAHIRGRYWSSTIDDISLWPSICLVYYSRLPAYSCKCVSLLQEKCMWLRWQGIWTNVEATPPSPPFVLLTRNSLKEQAAICHSLNPGFPPHWCRVTKEHLQICSACCTSSLYKQLWIWPQGSRYWPIQRLYNYMDT